MKKHFDLTQERGMDCHSLHLTLPFLFFSPLQPLALISRLLLFFDMSDYQVRLRKLMKNPLLKPRQFVSEPSCGDERGGGGEECEQKARATGGSQEIQLRMGSRTQPCRVISKPFDFSILTWHYY